MVSSKVKVEMLQQEIADLTNKKQMNDRRIGETKMIIDSTKIKIKKLSDLRDR